ncbi:hypothetical protein B0T14DRAFT_437169 [Immersiella caudata]|uniref:Zn(2)-C6 fungal-type domain-containing protein n=1 Tax=Immersiella caudata TaxID=314043 RepID=A0AA39WDS2_9PEZI|nr:hypothetical protein B0T14DRAFT_437169 [Immersiella caudata]
MVGVPGRSKGCHACRRRKKGCDLARPHCGRCRQAGIECDGYERERIFVHTDPAPTKGPSKALLPPAATVPRDAIREPFCRTLPVDIAISSSLARSAHRVGFITAIWELGSPNEQACELATILWIAGIQDKPIFLQSPCLQKSVMAVCLSSIGKERKTEWMIQEGLQLYGSAVKTLSTALSRLPPSTPPSDAMLVTTRVLAMHEMISGCAIQGRRHMQVSHAWPTHKMGELALLTARSPDSFAEGASHDMFIDARFMCVIAAVTVRRATILSQPDWTTIPWSKKPKTSRDLLIDIFVHLPSLLNQVDVIAGSNNPELRIVRTTECMEHAKSCERSLVAWFDASAPEGWELAGCPHLDYENATPDDARQANTMCLFWAIYAQVLIIIQSLSSLPSLEDTKYRLQMIRLCCQSISRTIPVFFVGEAKLVGCYQIVSMPMFFALDGLFFTETQTVSKDRLQLLELFLKPSKGGGSLAQFLTGLLEHSPAWQHTEAGKILAIQAQKDPLPGTEGVVTLMT